MDLNKQIRFKNSKMVYLVAGGLAGSIFVDGGITVGISTGGEVGIVDTSIFDFNRLFIIYFKHHK